MFVLLFAFSVTPLWADDDEKAADDKEEVSDEVEGPDEDGVIPVENVELIKKNLKKAAIVNGTIGEAKVFKSSGHGFLKFEEADVAIFIRKENLAKHKDWDLEKLVGLGVYVAGEVKIYRDQLELVIVGPDQIAATPDDFDLAKIPLPESSGSSSGGSSTAKKKVKKIAGSIVPSKKSYPEVSLNLESASVQTVAFYLKDTGMKVRDDPYGLPLDYLLPTVAPVTATVTKAEGAGPMQIVFPKPEEDSKGQIKGVVDQIAESLGGWPQDRVVTIDVDFDSRAFKDDPATLVVAALLHSLITGKEIASNVIISADVEDGGSTTMARGNDDGVTPNYQILKAIAEEATEPMRYICADMDTDEINDLALDGDWATLSNVTVLGAPTMQDGLNLIFAEDESDLGKALTAFDQAQAVIQKNGVAMVKNSHVQGRVMAAGKVG